MQVSCQLIFGYRKPGKFLLPDFSLPRAKDTPILVILILLETREGKIGQGVQPVTTVSLGAANLLLPNFSPPSSAALKAQPHATATSTSAATLPTTSPSIVTSISAFYRRINYIQILSLLNSTLNSKREYNYSVKWYSEKKSQLRKSTPNFSHHRN